MSSTVSGVYWKANYGEVSDSQKFRVGRVESDTWEASFPINELADLISVLNGVTSLSVGVIQKGAYLQARKVYAGLFTDVVIEPRLDTGVPAQIMRLAEGAMPDLIYTLQLLATALSAEFPDDWDFSDVPAVLAFDKYGRVTNPEAEKYFNEELGRLGISVNVKQFKARPGDQNSGEGANAGIQAAIDFVTSLGGGEVVVDDDYWVKGHVPGAAGNYLGDEGGIALKDGVHLRFTPSGVLRVIPNAESKYVCIRIFNKKNVRVSGPGRVIGERAEHTGSTGEWGYGVAITAGENITVEDISVSAMWGDGINIQRMNVSGTITVPKDVTVRNVTCDSNRRQGLSLEAGDWVLIEDSRFVNTGGVGGTAPMNGLNVEPSADTTKCSNVFIERCWFQGNSGFGCSVYMLGTRDVVVDDCDFVSNLGAWQFVCNLAGPNVRLSRSRFSGTVSECVHLSGGLGRVISDNVFDHKLRIAPNAVPNIATDVLISRNRWTVNAGTSISGLVEINEHSDQVEIVDNHFEHKGTRGSGVWMRTAAAVAPLTLQNIKISRNTFINMTNAIISGAVSNVEVISNTIQASADYAIRMTPTNCRIKDNHLLGSNLISSFAAMFIENNSANNQIEGNKIVRDPTVTVVETRRGDTGITFGASVVNTVVRATHITNIAARFSSYPTTHTETYIELTPGTWYVWP